jgi:hypothetical protein
MSPYSYMYCTCTMWTANEPVHRYAKQAQFTYFNIAPRSVATSPFPIFPGLTGIFHYRYEKRCRGSATSWARQFWQGGWHEWTTASGGGAAHDPAGSHFASSQRSRLFATRPLPNCSDVPTQPLGVYKNRSKSRRHRRWPVSASLRSKAPSGGELPRFRRWRYRSQPCNSSQVSTVGHSDDVIYRYCDPSSRFSQKPGINIKTVNLK